MPQGLSLEKRKREVQGAIPQILSKESSGYFLFSRLFFRTEHHYLFTDFLFQNQ
jgi:hypothetical protein